MNEERNLAERAPSLDRDGRRAYRVEIDGRDLTSAIVGAVAAVADCDPVTDGFCLYDAVDPDALKRLVAREDGRFAGKIVFELRGCRVEAHSHGGLVVHEQSDGPDGSHAPSPESA